MAFWSSRGKKVGRSSGLNAPYENPVRDYLQNVMKDVVQKYTEPFAWGTVDVKLTPLDKLTVFVARHLWF